MEVDAIESYWEGFFKQLLHSVLSYFSLDLQEKRLQFLSTYKWYLKKRITSCLQTIGHFVQDAIRLPMP